MQSHYPLRNRENMAQLVQALLEMDYEEELEAIIQPVKDKRSEAQRRLQYMWYTDISKEWGWEIVDVRNFYMRKSALNIFYRDDINGSSETLDAIRDVKAAGMVEQYEAMIKGFVKAITTNSFSVAQNIEYLNEIDRDATQRGVYLRIPDQMGYTRA